MAPPKKFPAKKVAAKKAAAKKAAAKKAAAKKAPAKEVAAATATATAEDFPKILGPGPCDRGDPLFEQIIVGPGQEVKAFFLLCSASGMVRVTLTRVGGGLGIEVGRTSKIPPDPNPREDVLTPLPPGRYIVSWDYAVSGPFQIVVELHVDGAPRYRKKRDFQNNLPVDSVSAPFEVRGAV